MLYCVSWLFLCCYCLIKTTNKINQQDFRFFLKTPSSWIACWENVLFAFKKLVYILIFFIRHSYLICLKES